MAAVGSIWSWLWWMNGSNTGLQFLCETELRDLHDFVFSVTAGFEVLILSGRQMWSQGCHLQQIVQIKCCWTIIYLCFQVLTSSPQHWYLHWRRLKTQEWCVDFRWCQDNNSQIHFWNTWKMFFAAWHTSAAVSSQVTVSSGGMLTQKLNVDDLQFEKGAFDGTMAYAQNKVMEADLQHQRRMTVMCLRVCLSVVVLSLWQRQQVILTERWASQHKEIHFSSMHPGWADTPGKQMVGSV